MIKVNERQKLNALLGFLHKTTWSVDKNIACDYEICENTAVLFLSIKFHASKPEYIFKRMNKIKDYKLKIVLVLLDSPNYNHTLRELYRTVDFTIVLAKNYEECANYIKSFEIAQNKSINVIRNKEKTIDNFLLEIPGINKENVVLLKSKYSSLKEILLTSADELAKLPGISKEKAKNVENFFKISLKK